MSDRRSIRFALIGAGVILLFALPLINAHPSFIYLAAMVGVLALVAMGLNVTMGYTGQVSLGHGALVAVGAYTAAILMTDQGWSFWLAAAVATFTGTLAGMVMALPALRLSSWYIALITLGFAMVARTLIVELEWLTGGYAGIVGIPRPSIGAIELGDRGVYWLVIVVDLIALALIASMARSRIGRSMMVVRDSPELARAIGVDATVIKLATFAVGGAAAGLAGALLATNNGMVSPDDFTLDFSIFFLIVVIIGGAGRLWGPIVGTLVFFAVPELLTSLDQWRGLIYGVGLLFLMVFAPRGIIGAVEAWRDRRTHRPDFVTQEPLATRSEHLASGSPAALSISEVSKSFGGVRALDGVSVEVAPGSVHAIVGPNGSGKTTLLNVVSRMLVPDSGRVRLDEADLLSTRAERLAASGVARVFQTPKLLPEASVSDNVVLGGYARRTASVLGVVLRTPGGRREEREVRAHAHEVLVELGLGSSESSQADLLPHGRQRLLEMCRALVARPRLLILDEPAAGLAPHELSALEQLIGSIRDGGTTVLLVEHHIELVARVADTVTVLDRGRLVVTATPDEALADRRVVEAYLGVSS